jgi:hypothetical protein
MHVACSVTFLHNFTFWEDKKNMCEVTLELSCHEGRKEKFSFSLYREIFHISAKIVRENFFTKIDENREWGIKLNNFFKNKIDVLRKVKYAVKITDFAF